MMGQNAAVMFIGSVRAAAMKGPQQLHDGLEHFLAEVLDDPANALPSRVRAGIYDTVSSQLASLKVAITEKRKHRFKAMRNRVIGALLVILGLSAPRIQSLVPEMWKPVVAVLIDALGD